jgi:hypothetical protein
MVALTKRPLGMSRREQRMASIAQSNHLEARFVTRPAQLIAPQPLRCRVLYEELGEPVLSSELRDRKPLARRPQSAVLDRSPSAGRQQLPR